MIRRKEHPAVKFTVEKAAGSTIMETGYNGSKGLSAAPPNYKNLSYHFVAMTVT